MKFYFSTFSGLGIDQAPFYPSAWDHVQISYLDGREYPEIEDGWCICRGDPTEAEHAALLADASTTYLPFENLSGDTIDLDQPLSEISSANRATILAEFEARHVPTDGITGSTTIREGLKRIYCRIRLRELLIYLDFGKQDFSATIGDIPPLQRKALKRRLENGGFDISGITNTATIKEAILLLSPQIVNTPID
jgi:hypothetical protein